MGEQLTTLGGGRRQTWRRHLWLRRGRPGLAIAVAAVVGAGAVGITAAIGSTRVSSEAVAAPAPGVGPFSVDTSSREASRQLFNQVHTASDGVTDGWSGGSVSPGCAPGTVSSAYLTAVLRRLNYFRAMAGLSAVTFV